MQDDAVDYIDPFTASGQPLPAETPIIKPVQPVQARKTDMRASVPSAPVKPSLKDVLKDPHKIYGMTHLQAIIVDLHLKRAGIHPSDKARMRYRLDNREKVRMWAYLKQGDAIRMIQELAS